MHFHICILLIVVSIGAVTGSPIQVEDPSRPQVNVGANLPFRVAGKIAGTMAMGHIIIKLNMTELANSFELLCKQPPILVQAYNITSSQKRLIADVSEHCQQLSDTLMDRKNMWFADLQQPVEGVEATRGKRSLGQITRTVYQQTCYNLNPLLPDPKRCSRDVVSLVISLISAASSAYTAYELHELSERVDKQNEANIEILENHESRLGMAEKSLALINKAIMSVSHQLAGVVRGIHIDEVILHLHIALSAAYDDVNRLIRGLNQLSLLRFSPDLAKPLQMGKVLDRLRVKMRDGAYLLSFTKVEDIFRCETSHLVYEDGQLVVLIHIPAYKQNTEQILYEFTSIPVILPSTNPDKRVAVRVSPDHRYLAISADDNSYKQFTDSELHSCTVAGSMYFCPSMAVYHRQKEVSCLYGLYRQDHITIEATCHWEVAVAEDYVLQLDSNNFLLYHHQKRDVKFVCDNDRNTKNLYQTVEGRKKIYVPPRCRCYTPSFILDGQANYSVTTTSYLEKNMNVTKLWDFPESANYGFEEIFRDLEMAGTKGGVKIPNIRARLTVARTSSWWSWSLRVTVAVLLLLAFGLVCWKLKSWWTKRQHKLNNVQGNQLRVRFWQKIPDSRQDPPTPLIQQDYQVPPRGPPAPPSIYRQASTQRPLPNPREGQAEIELEQVEHVYEQY